MKRLSHAFGSFIALFLLLAFAMQPVSVVRAEGKYINCDYETLTGERGRLSDFDGRVKVLLYGRIGSSAHTNGTLSLFDRISRCVSEQKAVFWGFDIGNPLETVREFTLKNSIDSVRVCGGSNQYSQDMWGHWRGAGNISTYVTLPVLIVIDQEGNYRLSGQGALTSEFLVEFISVLNQLCGEGTIDLEGLREMIPAYSYNEAAAAKRPTTAEGIRFYQDLAAVLFRASHPQMIALAEEITQGAVDDYERLRAIHDWVAESIFYDYDYYEGRTDATNLDPLDILANRYTICLGYANLTAGLCAAAGIPCRVVQGYTAGSGFTPEVLESYQTNHAWNEAYVDGRWIVLDPTWDSGNTYIDGAFTEGSVRWDYFDIDLMELSLDHKTVGCYYEAICKMCKPQTPDAPSKAGGNRRIRLTWPTISGVTSIRIWRSETETGGYEQMDELDPTASTWTDLNTQDGKTYFYRLQIGELETSLLGQGMLYGELSEPLMVVSGPVLGDVNDDGAIDALDALLALQHSVGLKILESGDFFCADANRSEVVDASDALLILQYSVGLILKLG